MGSDPRDRAFRDRRHTAFGLATTAETMLGKAGSDAEWVPMTPHTSQIVRDTQEQLCQAQAHLHSRLAALIPNG